MLDIFTKIKLDDLIEPGVLFRRINKSKDQQGKFVKPGDDSKSWILTEVIDMQEGRYLAENGIIRHEAEDELYIRKSGFIESSEHKKAWEIIQGWSLFQQHTNLHAQIKEFITGSFLPEQIIDWKKKDSLKNIFVPIQEKFKIGKYTEKVDPDKVRVERFREQISTLTDGKHLTYVAFIPRNTNSQPMFFSIGTKPHLETKKVLGEQIYGFHPNHGGHIKCSVGKDEKSVLLVDAGSNDLGAGVHTSLATAEMLAEALKILHPEFEYKPLAGRGAFGIQQSY